MRDYIKESISQSHKQLGEYYLFDNILIYFKDNLNNNINIKEVIKKIEYAIPQYLFQGIDEIFIGRFDEFAERKINSMYMDGAIYISNEQQNEKDIIDDIVHELAHSLEEIYTEEIYLDRKVEKEFIEKRKELYFLLKRERNKNINFEDFMNPEYSEAFDELLYKNIGYDVMNILTSTLFASPYAATSLREYFADGFEDYFLNKNTRLKKISPELYKKLEFLYNMV